MTPDAHDQQCEGCREQRLTKHQGVRIEHRVAVREYSATTSSTPKAARAMRASAWRSTACQARTATLPPWPRQWPTVHAASNPEHVEHLGLAPESHVEREDATSTSAAPRSTPGELPPADCTKGRSQVELLFTARNQKCEKPLTSVPNGAQSIVKVHSHGWWLRRQRFGRVGDHVGATTPARRTA